MTSYDVISLFTRWKLNKLGMSCEFPKCLLNSFNCQNVTGGFLFKPPPPPPLQGLRVNYNLCILTPYTIFMFLFFLFLSLLLPLPLLLFLLLLLLLLLINITIIFSIINISIQELKLLSVQRLVVTYHTLVLSWPSCNAQRSRDDQLKT